MDLLMLLVTLLGVAVKGSVGQASPPSLTVEVEVFEEQPSGTVLTNLVTAAELSKHYSTDALSKLYFVLMEHSSSSQHLIRVDSEANVLVRQPIDRDELCANVEPCELELDFTLQPFTDFNNLLKLTLRILDINDNVPKFQAPSTILELSESAQRGSQLVLPAATDADQGEFGVQGYHLLGDPEGVFELRVIKNPGSTDDVSLILQQQVDRETVDVYHLKVSDISFRFRALNLARCLYSLTYMPG